MKQDWLKILFLCTLALSIATEAQGQIIQNFNQSVNQIGDCWQNYNMQITTKNTINKNNQKKALIGQSPDGNPAYFFTSPLIYFSGGGVINFNHKLNGTDGFWRELNVYLLDSNEKLVQKIHHYQYKLNGVAINGNPTNVVNVTVPITWTGTYILQWEFSGDGGNSLAMVDDIYIDGVDQSDGTNDNGYGYCRADDVVYDTVCAGSQVLRTVPYPIAQSDWYWETITPSGATIDSTFITGEKDTSVYVNWSPTAAGDYLLRATETRYPYMTTTYSIDFYIHVLPAPTVNMQIDSVCPGYAPWVHFNFSGAAPFDFSFTDGDSIYSGRHSGSSASYQLPALKNTRTIDILNLQGDNGCYADTSGLSAPAIVFPPPAGGPIWHL